MRLLGRRLRIQVLLDFAKAEGYDADKIKRLEDVLARGKDVDEAINEFRKLQDNGLSHNQRKPCTTTKACHSKRGR